MGEYQISQENFYFLEVGQLCKRTPVTCSPETGLVEVAAIMQEENISGIVAIEENLPVGIVTLRDLRNQIARDLMAINGMKVKDLMQTRLITVGLDEPLFKAIFKMARHNIHRLVVVNPDGAMAGIVTNSDLLRVQSSCPLYISQEIEAAEDFEQLRSTGGRLTELVRFVVRSGADIQSIIGLISHFNDLMTMQVITLLKGLEGVTLPRSAAFMVLGSEGRGEQTLRTDQDNAIVYADSTSSEELDQIRLFADRMVSRLEYIGVPLCPGGIMANNRQWCHSLSTWLRIINSWISRPTQKNVVRFGMFQDMRVVHGNLSLEKKLRQQIIQSSGENRLFLSYAAHNIMQFEPPLGLFSRIKLEGEGEHKGKLDLKKAGIFALTQGLTLLLLQQGGMGGNSWEKIERLRQGRQINQQDLDEIEAAFSLLVKYRLTAQLESIKRGEQPDNYCDPKLLSHRELEQLRGALKTVNLMLQMLKSSFQLDLIRL